MSGHIVTGGPIARIFPLDSGWPSAALLVVASTGKNVVLIDVADDLDFIVARSGGSPLLVTTGGRVLALTLDRSRSGARLLRGLRYSVAVPQQIVILHFVDGIETPIAELAAVLSDLRVVASESWASRVGPWP